MNALLRLSDSLRRMLESVARASAWLLLLMAAVTCFDVLARKTGIPAPADEAAGAGVALPSYDANGNKTRQTRFIDRVPESVDLATATGADVMAAVTAKPAEDETTLYAYDAANRLISQSDVMIAAGETTNATANDITIETSYDAAGNFTERVDAAGNRSQLAYDALGHITQTLTPNGAASFVEYDAAGSKLRAWTGGLPNQSAQQATNVAASAGGGLTISWVQPGADSQSWVVWDTAARDIPEGKTPHDAYHNETGHVGSGAVSVSISAAADTTIYFRVVSQDSAGNIAWTEERVATVPPGIESLSVAQAGDDLQIKVRFNATVQDPLLRFGAAGGTLDQSVAFVAQQDGSYMATIADPADPQALAFRIEWESRRCRPSARARYPSRRAESTTQWPAWSGFLFRSRAVRPSATANSCSSMGCATRLPRASSTSCSSIRS